MLFKKNDIYQKKLFYVFYTHFNSENGNPKFFKILKINCFQQKWYVLENLKHSIFQNLKIIFFFKMVLIEKT